MIYITDNKTKEYQGIKVDRILSRSWALFDRDGNLGIIKFYPNNMFTLDILKQIIGKAFNKKIYFINDNPIAFRAKKKIKPLRFTTGDSCFIYQDYTMFDSEDIGRIRGSSGGGFYHYNKDNILHEGEIFYESDEGSLEDFIRTGRQITDSARQDKIACDGCGRFLHEDDCFYPERGGETFCENCYYEYFVNCDGCGCEVSRDDSNYVESTDKNYCDRCFKKKFSSCEGCGETIRKVDAFVENGVYFCENCVDKSKIIECDNCKADNFICDSCVKSTANQKYEVKCKECGKIITFSKDLCNC
jgi:hypothetical protein